MLGVDGVVAVVDVDEEVSQAVLFSLLVSALRLGAKKDVIIVFQYLISLFLNIANGNQRASEASIWRLESRKLGMYEQAGYEERLLVLCRS